MLGVVGESGSGKTTVARCLVGLQAPDSGTITLCGSVVHGRRTPEQRRAAQLVFQDPYASLNPRLRIGTVLRELLATHRTRARRGGRGALPGADGPRRPARRRARQLPLGVLGGQRQRIAIARALAVEPSVLVADEPISALDVSVQATILALFADLRDRLGIGVVMISHNLAAVRHVCDHVAVMYLGKVVEQGTRDEVFGDLAPSLHRRPARRCPACATWVGPGGVQARRRPTEPDCTAKRLLVPPTLSPRRGSLRQGVARAAGGLPGKPARRRLSLPRRAPMRRWGAQRQLPDWVPVRGGIRGYASPHTLAHRLIRSNRSVAGGTDPVGMSTTSSGPRGAAFR